VYLTQGVDYITVSDAGAGAIAVAKIDGTWSSANGAVDINGWSTSGENYIKIYTTGTARHNGVWDATKFRLTVTLSGGVLSLSGGAAHVIIDGLQIENGTAGSCQGIRENCTDSNMFRQISNCIIRNTGVGGSGKRGYSTETGVADNKLWNNIFYGWNVGIYIYTPAHSTTTVYNNTLVDCQMNIYGPWQADGASLYLVNNLVKGTGTDYALDFTGLGTDIRSNNVSSDESSPNASFRSSTASFANEGGGNYLLSSTDTVAMDQGTDLPGDAQLAFNYDIQGDIRPMVNAWDIGADEAEGIPDSTAPAAVTNLAALTGTNSGEINLTWTAPGDDGAEWAITGGRYAIQYSDTESVTWSTGSAQIVFSTDTTPGDWQSRVVGGLTEGVTYYFRIWTADEIPNWSDECIPGATSWAQFVVDISSPTDISFVYDGLGADIAVTASTGSLSANWAESDDPESGISKYLYGIGDTPGSTGVVGWTDIGMSTYVIHTALSLTPGVTYYFTVKAVNGKSLESNAANSDGQWVDDITGPTDISDVYDGLGVDIGVTTSTDTLSANWTESDDPESGISKYLYAIGTTAGGTETTGWTSTADGTVRSVTKTGLTLTIGTTYYFTVKAENGVGLQSNPASSDGQWVKELIGANPALSWTGETNYSSDGLNPESGFVFSTTFTYRVKYTDADNDAPKPAYPKVYILENGSSITGSPFVMGEVDSGDTTYTDGKLYTYSTTLSNAGLTYTYRFEAYDVNDGQATGAPTSDTDGPAVSTGSIVMNVSPTTLVFGEVELSRSKVLSFTITNTGAGTLNGTISDDKEWIIVDPTSFNSNNQTVYVLVDNNVLNESQGEYTGTVTVDAGAAGTETVAVSVVATCVFTRPNPYNPTGSQELTFFGSGIVANDTTIKIYTLAGELVKILQETKEESGEYIIEWDGKNESGDEVISGIYLYTTESSKEKNACSFTVIKK
jgi:hypothetical protein